MQTSSRPVSQPSSSGSEITRRVHNNIPAPVAKVESQNSEGTGVTLPSQPMKPSDVLKGLVQTGIAYPNSWNFKNETPFSEYNSDGSVVEFIIKPTDFSPTNYKLKEIRTYN